MYFFSIVGLLIVRRERLPNSSGGAIPACQP
jgi:hypothetical protein